MNCRALLGSIALAVLAAACATGPGQGDAMPRPQYKGEVGESPVGVIPDADLRDDARNRDVRITIEYPTRSAANPLVVFSPGYGLTNNAYVGLSSYWASQGYVVIRVAHADAGKKPEGDIWLTQTEADRRDRVRDLAFVLDSLDALERRYPELQGKIDRGKIAVGGHSYGAYTAMLIGGVRTFPGGVSYADARVKAVIAMSPQGPGASRGLTDESWSALRVPTLFMTGTRDQGFTEMETPEWRRQAFERSAPGDKWLVVVEHARHGTFVGRYDAFIEAQARERETEMPEVEAPRGAPIDPSRAPARTPNRVGGSSAAAAAVRERDLFATIKSLSLAFLDAYLKGDSKGREALQKAQSEGGVEVRSK